MTRRTAWAVAIVIGTAVVFAAGGGCDTPREIKEAKPISTEPSNPSAIVISDKAPDKSDPAAASVIEAAMAAHTGKKPELLAALRTSTFTRAGYIVGGVNRMKQTWTVHAGWPDRFRVKAELENGITMTIAWGPNGGWQHATGQGKFPLPANGVRDYKIDITGDWLSLLFPFADSGVVYAPAPDQTFDGKPATGIHFWHPNLAPAVVYFNKETKLLAAITYEGREDGRKVTKEITVLSSRSFDGVTFPERTVVRSNSNLIAEWTLTALEPKPTLDPKLFDEL